MVGAIGVATAGENTGVSVLVRLWFARGGVELGSGCFGFLFPASDRFLRWTSPRRVQTLAART